MENRKHNNDIFDYEGISSHKTRYNDILEYSFIHWVLSGPLLGGANLFDNFHRMKLAYKFYVNNENPPIDWSKLSIVKHISNRFTCWLLFFPSKKEYSSDSIVIGVVIKHIKNKRPLYFPLTPIDLKEHWPIKQEFLDTLKIADTTKTSFIEVIISILEQKSRIFQQINRTI